MNALEQLTKISLPKKLGALAAIVALVFVGYWYIYASSVLEEIEALQEKHAQLLTQKQAAQRRKSTYEKDRRRRDELKKNYAQQIRALPTEAEMSGFLENLNSQADLVGLELISVKPQNEQPAQYYSRIPVALELRGTYLQLAKFFYLVGNLDRIINIENISLMVSEVDETGIQIEANVLATTFRSVKANSQNTDREGEKKKVKKKKR